MAAKLLSSAEAHLYKEDADEALKDADSALESFREAKDSKGIADALRVVINATILKGDRKGANKLAKDQLASFREAGDKKGVAKMLLSVAEVNSDKRGPKNRENALEAAREARALLQEQGEAKLEAA
eukprot:CAMPEP_0204564720 /NCGR_PEP_ID=MMETSP0661-20131031/35060_1 /ASSEMBLY_ACC=CAM_ASM_000606 /TAXON_ID=109239 /ORGANISM="Alexandrium margalefi, Strain AMGDE01CS-322" /LENGTH=126 /DNA_ID=CAMNT_0051572397 /DNA_START=33 /DNA_END=410 /DNA_ORIENTATION=-